MMNEKSKLIITRQEDKVFYGYFQGDQPIELYCEPCVKEEGSIVGNIYAARVDKVAEDIRGAFVDIFPGQKCYYPLKNNGIRPVKLSPGHEDRLYAGDLILVQVTKDPVKTKLPAAEGNISLSGKYFVLTFPDRRCGISKKISDQEERKRLSDIVENFLKNHSPQTPFGLIARTNAVGIEKEQLEKELSLLYLRYLRLIKKAKASPGKTCLYESPPHYVVFASDLPSRELTEVVTDQQDIYKELEAYYKDSGDPELLSKLSLYDDDYPLAKLYRLKTHYENALDKQVWLKSGGSLIIEPTEAMVVIDVNTGSVTKSKKKDEDLFFRINCEAAAEIGRQLRLRNLSGIIVIDFINMRYEKHQKKLLQYLQEISGQDRVRTRVIDITALNLVEMTRQKVRKPLHEQMAKAIVT